MWYLAAIDSAKEETPYGDIISKIEQTPAPKTCTQSPSSVVAALIRKGALVQTVYVDGQLYDGTVNDLQNDESVLDDAVISYAVMSTDIGLEVAGEYTAKRKIAQLFETRPEYARAFTMVLSACSAPGGILRDDLEAMLVEDGDVLRIDPRTGIPTIFPAYFTGELENAGALVWDKTWQTTQEGEEFLRRAG